MPDNFLSEIILNGVKYSLKTSDSAYPVSGVKGNREKTYRQGKINITPDNIGAVSTDANQKLTSTEQSNARTNLGISDMTQEEAEAGSSTVGKLISPKVLKDSALISGVKGNRESAYRKGKVNLTPDNIGAVSTDANQSLSDKERSNAIANLGLGAMTQAEAEKGSSTAGKLISPKVLRNAALPTHSVTNEFETLAELWTEAEKLMGSTEACIIRCKITKDFGIGTSWMRLIISEQNKSGNGSYSVGGTILKMNTDGMFFYKVSGGKNGTSDLKATRMSLSGATVTNTTLKID